jgi:hypothetical protein
VTYTGPVVGKMFDATRGTAVEIGMGPILLGVIVLAFLIRTARPGPDLGTVQAYYRLWPFSH